MSIRPSVRAAAAAGGGGGGGGGRLRALLLCGAMLSLALR